jgi:8-oxo-dGTP pyrophosphatase MutT (NUDIX family)
MFVVSDDADDILMILRTDNGNWAVTDGAVDLGESVAQAAIHETLNETEIECSLGQAPPGIGRRRSPAR